MSENPYSSLEVQNTPQSARRWRSALLMVFLLAAVGSVLAAMFLPFWHRGRVHQCSSNLRQIHLALESYHDDYGSFPPAYTVDTKGRPLHSWRTLLLPYLDQTNLYQQIDLSKPWNDPANAQALETSLLVFNCPSARMPSNHTIYLGVCGLESCFCANSRKSFSDITDGTSNTLLVIEAPQDQTVPWMSPQDADHALILEVSTESELAHGDSIHAVLADGRVRFINVNTDRSTLKALLTISGGEVVGEF